MDGLSKKCLYVVRHDEIHGCVDDYQFSFSTAV